LDLRSIGGMQKTAWWQHGIIYEVYPRSFQDSNGDGVGDLNGILQRLDYLVKLGVDALWISPFYPSPMADFGYDVADYCGIDPLFGTMQDFNQLLQETHRRGLKLILDLVPNHTSDQHPWFLESRSSRENSKRDWYLWRDEPNNWQSNFGGSGWEWDDVTGQYYYHSFLKQQPDLNWRNPLVRRAIFEVMRFWLARGVDGFRVDVIWLMIKDDQFRDNPPNPSYRAGQPSSHRFLPVFNSDRPEVHDVVSEMREVVDDYTDRVLIGEIYLPIPKLMAYYGKDLGGAQLPFNFQLLQTPWTAEALARAISEYGNALPTDAWPNWVLGNHDNARIATRVGIHHVRLAAMLLLSLPGTITLYYGEEIGMTNVPIPPDAVQDPAEKNEPGIGLGRDPERTPMPWDSSPLAGFTTGRPWLPLGEDHASLNVEKSDQDPESILNLYRTLIALRRSHSVLVTGELHSIAAANDVLTYERHGCGERLRIILNLGAAPATIPSEVSEILAATSLGCTSERPNKLIQLGAATGLIVRLHT
jgi:alpha-glucosidase